MGKTVDLDGILEDLDATTTLEGLQKITERVLDAFDWSGSTINRWAKVAMKPIGKPGA